MDKLITYAPRILGIATILFISMFALDVFEPGKPWLEVLTELSMHLIPSAILTIALLVGWQFERVGGVLHILIGTASMFLMRGPILSYLIIGGPIMCTGILFLVSYWWRKKRNLI